MTYPFPGMNPWLESPALWHDVHQSLIIALRDDLAVRLRPRYFVAVETHTYVTLPPELSTRIRYPDLLILQRSQAKPVATATAATDYDPYLKVELPLDPLEEGYLEVRLVTTGEVVTVIELLSHANKQGGRSREDYIQKRESLLGAYVHFVELDLLRAGAPMPHAEVDGSGYRLFIRRRDEPREARLYPFGVRQRIPVFPLPLLPDDAEPPVNINALLAGLFERAGYELVLDYTRPPEPPLSPEDAEWVAQHTGFQFNRPR